MKTEIEVTLRVTIKHDKNMPCVDENSVKSVFNDAFLLLENCAGYYCYGGNGDEHPQEVNVKVVGLKENKVPIPVKNYGTNMVPWKG